MSLIGLLAVTEKQVTQRSSYRETRITQCTVVAQYVPRFWDLVSHVKPDPPVPAQPANPTIQSPHRNLPNLSLHAWIIEHQQSRRKASLRQ